MTGICFYCRQLTSMHGMSCVGYRHKLYAPSICSSFTFEGKVKVLTLRQIDTEIQNRRFTDRDSSVSSRSAS